MDNNHAAHGMAGEELQLKDLEIEVNFPNSTSRPVLLYGELVERQEFDDKEAGARDRIHSRFVLRISGQTGRLVAEQVKPSAVPSFLSKAEDEDDEDEDA